MKDWMFLLGAILCEVTATSSLKAANGFTRLWPSLIVLVGYSASFYLLSLSLKALPIGVAYAVWSGLGTALIALVGWYFLGQVLDWAALAGIGLIVSGVLMINLFSRLGSH